MIREVVVSDGPGAEDIIVGPVTPDREGRFALEVPKSAMTSPTAIGEAGSIRWFVRVEVQETARRKLAAMSEIHIGGGPAEEGVTSVTFPPRRKVSARR